MLAARQRRCSTGVGKWEFHAKRKIEENVPMKKPLNGTNLELVWRNRSLGILSQGFFSTRREKGENPIIFLNRSL
jgi:hypothetical protein